MRLTNKTIVTPGGIQWLQVAVVVAVIQNKHHYGFRMEVNSAAVHQRGSKTLKTLVIKVKILPGYCWLI